MAMNRTGWLMDPAPKDKNRENGPPASPPILQEAISASETGKTASDLRRILGEVEKTLTGLLTATQRQIHAIENGEQTALWDVLPTEYGLELAGGSVILQELLYLYYQANWLNPHLISCPTNKGLSRLSAAAIGAVGLRYDKDRIVIYLPYLPPRGQQKRDIINDLLLSRLSEVSDFPSWPKYHIAFTHIHSSADDLPRDLDNFNYKPTIDRIAFAISKPDSPAHCSISMDGICVENLVPGVYITVSQKSEKSLDFSIFHNLAPLKNHACSP